jgi:hypothetical protein
MRHAVLLPAAVLLLGCAFPAAAPVKPVAAKNAGAENLVVGPPKVSKPPAEPWIDAERAAGRIADIRVRVVSVIYDHVSANIQNSIPVHPVAWQT